MKRVLVTGATDGIGLETARRLAGLGLHVLVHGRTPAKAERAAAAIGPDATTPVSGDFTDFGDVAALAADVATRGPLDVLVNNAGTYRKHREMNADGIELTMAVNHFAPFLLTRRLLPVLERAPAARIVNVSSMTHEDGTLRKKRLAADLLDPGGARGWSGYDAYATSKLANVLFTVALAARLPRTATANALHPGVISTKLLRAGFGGGGGDVAEGARTSVHLATSPEVEGTSGGYYDACRPARAGRAARDGALAEALWQESERVLCDYL